MNRIRFLFLVLFFMGICKMDAQTYISMRPNWTFNTPVAENTTYEYYVSKGVGDTEVEARKDAFVIALKEAQTRIGIGANSSEILYAFQASEKDFNVIASDYNIPMKEVCSFSEQSREGRWYYYQLLQIATRGNVVPIFKPYLGDCYDFSKAKELREIMKEEYKDVIAAQKQTVKQQKKEERRTQLKNRLNYAEGNYIAWGIVGAGYPWNLTTSFNFRYGGVVGFGLYADIGLSFTHINVQNGASSPDYSYTTYTSFHYAGGLKFYPFKGIHIGAGYGSIQKPKVDIMYDYGSELDKDEAKSVRKKINDVNSHGLQVHTGYDLSINKFYLGFNVGCSFDFNHKTINPFANIKIGVAFNYD